MSLLLALAGAAPVEYTLDCAAGSYAIVGSDATLQVVHNYTLACAAGAYEVVGSDAELQYVAGARPKSGIYRSVFTQRQRLAREAKERGVAPKLPEILVQIEGEVEEDAAEVPTPKAAPAPAVPAKLPIVFGPDPGVPVRQLLNDITAPIELAPEQQAAIAKAAAHVQAQVQARAATRQAAEMLRQAQEAAEAQQREEEEALLLLLAY